ncbi:hypothetical protein DY000_02000419 [Brassica cretica]|uniref:Uncharacterized protein n=1 Tax=Brassica cretica TaxID=69181 RepID=A0ABQ7C2P0_BRACR|nr:hypothetical protein DY000_02000419 [Brassica cretica]
MEADSMETHQLGRFDRSGGLELATNGAEEEENIDFIYTQDDDEGERVIDERSNKTVTRKSLVTATISRLISDIQNVQKMEKPGERACEQH